MHARTTTKAASVWLAVTALLLAYLLMPGCGGESSEIEELIHKAQEAGAAIDSYNMQLTMFFEMPDTGKMKTEELAMDVAGNDIRLKDTFYDLDTGEGTVIQEIVRVGDKQWRKDLSSGEWVEEEPSLGDETAATYTSHISDFLSNSSSAENLGEETKNGINTVHLRFQLSPENVYNLLPEMPDSNLESNAGGQVDVWIDPVTYFPARYEMVFRNVILGQGYENTNVYIEIDITGINQTAGITPPV